MSSTQPSWAGSTRSSISRSAKKKKYGRAYQLSAEYSDSGELKDFPESDGNGQTQQPLEQKEHFGSSHTNVDSGITDKEAPGLF